MAGSSVESSSISRSTKILKKPGMIIEASLMTIEGTSTIMAVTQLHPKPSKNSNKKPQRLTRSTAWALPSEKPRSRAIGMKALCSFQQPWQ